MDVVGILIQFLCLIFNILTCPIRGSRMLHAFCFPGQRATAVFMGLTTGHLHAILATLTTAITSFAIAALLVWQRYAFIRPGVYVVRQLLA